MASRKGQSEVAALKAAEAEAQGIVSAAREERKLKMRQAQAEAKKEIDEYRALREAKLRSVQPEAQALDEKIRRVTQATSSQISQLEAEYQRNKEAVVAMLLQVVMNIENPFKQ